MAETAAPDPDQPAHRYSAALAQEIEARWQDRWEAEGTFEAPNPVGDLSKGFDGVSERPKAFVLDMFPYPSGAGLHVGHPLGFIGTDVYTRYLRMTGHNVLYTMGFDSFGLPAEQYALKTNTHPAITTEQNIATYRGQLRRLGLGHDRRRSIETTDPAYYRWTQWIFLQLFGSWYDADAGRARPVAELEAELDAGTRSPAAGTNPSGTPWSELDVSGRRRVLNAHRLAYLDEVPVNWCPGLGTVLSNEEVTADGRSERGDFPVYRRPMKQWMLRITAYADRLVDDLDGLDWSDAIKTQQRNWIGRSTGARRHLRHAGRRPRRVHHPARHAVRRDLHGRRTRAPARRGADHRCLAGGHPAGVDRRRGVAGRGRHRVRRGDPQPLRPRPPDRGQGQDGRLHRLLRHQPGERRADPRVRRRLRPHGLRHRGDHGRAIGRPARLRVRPRLRPAHRRDRRPSGGVVRGARPPDRGTDVGVALRLQRRRAGGAVGQRRRLPRRDGGGRGQGHHHGLAGGEGARRGHRPVQAARLAVQPPALLGRAVPDRVRRRRRASGAARLGPAADPAADGGLHAPHLRRRGLRARAPAGPGRRVGRGHARPGRR